MSVLRIRDRATDEVVHTMEVRYPRGSSQYERMWDGLVYKVDFERFYVEEPDE